MLKDEIKTQIIQAMRDKDVIRKEILRVVLGEFQTIESRDGQISEERCQKVIRKSIENNKEVILIVQKEEDKEKLEKENEILESFLPKLLTKEEILFYCIFSNNYEFTEALQKEKNVGKAIGMVMKYFKEQNLPVNGKDVAEVVKEMKKND